MIGARLLGRPNRSLLTRTLPLLLITTVVFAGTTASHSATSGNTATWLQSRSDNRRSGFNPSETQITPGAVGSLRLTKIVGFPFAGPTPPLVYGGTLYTVGLSLIDPNTSGGNPTNLVNQSTLTSLNGASGKVGYTRIIGCDRGLANAIPAISATARIMVIPMDIYCDTSSGDGHLLGVDLATGSVTWDSAFNQTWGNPVVLGGTVYIKSGGLGGDVVSSFAAATGAPGWYYAPQGHVGDSSVGGGNVYFRENVGGVNMLTALDASTGAHLWTRGSATGVPTLGTGRVYVACDQGMCSYNSQGTLRWSFASGTGEPAFANGILFVACQTDQLCALDAGTGTLLWHTGVSPNISTITVAGGVVFVNVATDGAPNDQIGFCTVDAGNGQPILNQYGSTCFGPGAARGKQATGLSIELPNDLAVVNGHVYLVNGNRVYIFSLPST
jgi:outer membrane protein assembly factor BamB